MKGLHIDCKEQGVFLLETRTVKRQFGFLNNSLHVIISKNEFSVLPQDKEIGVNFIRNHITLANCETFLSHILFRGQI